MWMCWLWNGGFTEGREWLSSALRLNAGTAARAKGLWGAGWLAYHQGDFSQTARCAEQLLAAAARTGDPLDERNGLTLRGMSAMADGRFGDAVHIFERGLTLASAREQEAPWLVATSILNLGAALLHAGSIPAAEQMFEDARTRYHHLGDEAYAVRADRHLAACLLVRGDLPSAGTLLRGCVPDPGGEWGLAETLELLAAVDAAAGNIRRSGLLAGAASAIRDRIGARPHPFDSALANRYLAGVRHSATWYEAHDAGHALTLGRHPRAAPTSDLTSAHPDRDGVV
jgi:tetratricopeptide (TPR) repeat protein